MNRTPCAYHYLETDIGCRSDPDMAPGLYLIKSKEEVSECTIPDIDPVGESQRVKCDGSDSHTTGALL